MRKLQDFRRDLIDCLEIQTYTQLFKDLNEDINFFAKDLEMSEIEVLEFAKGVLYKEWRAGQLRQGDAPYISGEEFRENNDIKKFYFDNAETYPMALLATCEWFQECGGTYSPWTEQDLKDCFNELLKQEEI